MVLPEPVSRVKQAGCRRLLKEPTQTTTTGKQRKRRRRQNRRRVVSCTITKSIIVLVLRYGTKNNNSILERHCHTWVESPLALPSRGGGSLLLFVPSWSNTQLVLPNTTPYQHWPPLTLEQPSTLVLHCRWCWEAPCWHPMRQAGVAVWSSRAGSAMPQNRSCHSVLWLLGYSPCLEEEQDGRFTCNSCRLLTSHLSRDCCKCKTSVPEQTPGTCGSGVGEAKDLRPSPFRECWWPPRPPPPSSLRFHPSLLSPFLQSAPPSSQQGYWRGEEKGKNC